MVLVIVIKRKGEGFIVFWFLSLTQAFKSTYFLSGKETGLSFFFLIKAFGGAPVDTANASNRHSVGVRPDWIRVVQILHGKVVGRDQTRLVLFNSLLSVLGWLGFKRWEVGRKRERQTQTQMSKSNTKQSNNRICTFFPNMPNIVPLALRLRIAMELSVPFLSTSLRLWRLCIETVSTSESFRCNSSKSIIWMSSGGTSPVLYLSIVCRESWEEEGGCVTRRVHSTSTLSILGGVS